VSLDQSTTDLPNAVNMARRVRQGPGKDCVGSSKYQPFLSSMLGSVHSGSKAGPNLRASEMTRALTLPVLWLTLGQLAVLVVEVSVAKLVGQRNDLIVPRLHGLRDRLRSYDLAHESTCPRC
jgi:hypothetical protein